SMVARSDAPSCFVPKVALVADMSDGCPRVTSAFQVGMQLDSREVFTGADCHTGDALAGHFYLLGDPLNLAVFPAILPQGNGHGRVRTFSAGDGVPVPHLGAHLYDSMLGIECRAAPASDGVLRCLPLDGPTLVDGDAGAAGFADADCTTPLARLGARFDCGAP